MKPKQAATVIVLRPAEHQGFEVFLTRRPKTMAFLGGMYCFPGGTLRREDCAEVMRRRCHGLTPNEARNIAGAHFSPREALGIWVAAIRELYEETGILLARQSPDRLKPPMESNCLAEKHDALIREETSFQALLESENLLCDLSSLGYFSHWQTPSQVAMRFDTHFFIARMPADQTALGTTPEVADSVWLTPDRALQLSSTGELPMIFPTFASLRTLADFATIESLVKTYFKRDMAALSRLEDSSA